MEAVRVFHVDASQLIEFRASVIGSPHPLYSGLQCTRVIAFGDDDRLVFGSKDDVHVVYETLPDPDVVLEVSGA
jgi:hypothetical protein